MLKTVLFGFMDEGCISLRKLEDNCKVNIRYKYLMAGKRPSYRTFGYFINTVLKNQAESLFYEITQKIITKEQRQDEKVQNENTVTQEKAKV